MMRAALRSGAVCLLIFLAVADSRAQDEPDSVAADTIRNKYLPTGIRVGYDLISAVKSQTQDDFNGWEIQGDIDFNRYYFVVEYGRWGRNFNADSASYANDGRYWRVGADVNFLTKDPDRNMFFLGMRYGRSQFTESMSLTRYDPLWGLLSDNFYHADLDASWIELTAGLRVRFLKIFYLGYTGRFKFGLSTDDTPEMVPHDVPGFGKTNKETTWGFTYYLMLRLPLRKAPPPASADD